MKFEYKARTKDGELQVGNVEASNKDAALNVLFGHGLFVLSIENRQALVRQNNESDEADKIRRLYDFHAPVFDAYRVAGVGL